MHTSDLTVSEALALMDCPAGSWGLLDRDGHRFAWLRAHGGVYLTGNDCHGSDTMQMACEMRTPVRIATDAGVIVTLDEVGDDDELADILTTGMLESLPDDAVVFAGELGNPAHSGDFTLACRVGGVWLVSDCGPGLAYEFREYLFEGEPGAALYDEGRDDAEFIHQRSVAHGVPDSVTVLHRA